MKIPFEHWLMLEDGYWYYDPPREVGVFNANSLRQIADLLDEMNKDWDEQIIRDLELKNKTWR